MVSKIRINYTVRWAAPAEEYLFIFTHFIGCGNNFATNRTNAARLLKKFRQGNTAFLNAFKYIRCGENVNTVHGISRVALARQSTVYMLLYSTMKGRIHALESPTATLPFCELPQALPFDPAETPSSRPSGVA